MKLHSLIVDDFLTQFDALRAYADTASYSAVENPVDGVSYPGICINIPVHIGREIEDRLRVVCDMRQMGVMFMRLSLAGIPVPHQAHTDISMGQFSLMLYLNWPEHCVGGTALVRHSSGMDRNPINEDQEELWKRDTNKPSMWTPYMLAEMRPNRAFIFDASLFHRAEPIGGFGDNSKNGRLVLTAFFS